MLHATKCAMEFALISHLFKRVLDSNGKQRTLHHFMRGQHPALRMDIEPVERWRVILRHGSFVEVLRERGVVGAVEWLPDEGATVTAVQVVL